MKRKEQRKKSPQSYQEREYRAVEQSGLVSSYVTMVETDLHILAPVNVEDETLRLVADIRRQIEGYIRQNSLFADSLHPLPQDNAAPAIVQDMLEAGLKAGVGPMAAVAGVIAQYVGQGLNDTGVEDLIVENGGDIFIARTQECTVAIFAGTLPLSDKVGIRLLPESMPCGVCCSSGTIGHSLSLGEADAVVVTASSTPLADAAATRLGNEVTHGPKSIQKALQVAQTITGISGAVIIKDQQIGAWGDIELVRL